jgi:hypothetical protein
VKAVFHAEVRDPRSILLSTGLFHVATELAIDGIDLFNDVGVFQCILFRVLQGDNGIITVRLEGVAVQTCEKGESVGIPAPPQILAEFGQLVLGGHDWPGKQDEEVYGLSGNHGDLPVFPQQGGVCKRLHDTIKKGPAALGRSRVDRSMARLV